MVYMFIDIVYEQKIARPNDRANIIASIIKFCSNAAADISAL